MAEENWSVSFQEANLSLFTISGNLRETLNNNAGCIPRVRGWYIFCEDDISREEYRLSTFREFHVASPNYANLAEAGYFFTGTSGLVICYACGMSVDLLQQFDTLSIKRWHFEDCGFAATDTPDCSHISDLFELLQITPRVMQDQAFTRVLEWKYSDGTNFTLRYPTHLPEQIRQQGGTFEIQSSSIFIEGGSYRIYIDDQGHSASRQWRMANVETNEHRQFLCNLSLRRELDRLISYSRCPQEVPRDWIASLAKNGIFYLGDRDRVQCFSCGAYSENLHIEGSNEMYGSHYRDCSMMHEIDFRNIPIPEEPETDQERERNYPCNNAANPTMENEASRLETFEHDWPADHTEATPEQMAEAGLYFCGEEDEVECFYCGGHLDQWEKHDDPWVEHARWFPNCQFLLRKKGQKFVAQQLSEHPHLDRPSIDQQTDFPEESRMCKICTANAARIAFMLCGHMVCCMKCQQNLQSCPICRNEIEGKIDTEERLCQKCEVHPASTIFRPCLHVILCANCVQGICRCTECWQEVLDSTPIFL